MKRVVQKIQSFQKYVDCWWYPPVMAILAAMDHFVIVLPVDGMLVSSILISPKRWLRLVFAFTLGSALGAFSIGFLVHWIGVEVFRDIWPSMFDSSLWIWMEDFFKAHGSIVVLLSAMSPSPQQPAVIITALAGGSLWPILPMLLLGRFLKFLVVGFITSYAPEKIGKLWGIQREIHQFDDEQK